MRKNRRRHRPSRALLGEHPASYYSKKSMPPGWEPICTALRAVEPNIGRGWNSLHVVARRALECTGAEHRKFERFWGCRETEGRKAISRYLNELKRDEPVRYAALFRAEGAPQSNGASAEKAKPQDLSPLNVSNLTDEDAFDREVAAATSIGAGRLERLEAEIKVLRRWVLTQKHRLDAV